MTWVTIGWCAKSVGVSRQAVWKRIAKLGLITWAVRPKYVLMLDEDVEAWLAERQAGAA